MKVSKKLTGATTKLERAVQAILNAKIERDYSAESVLNDLLSNGCQSGMIGALICYADTVKFYKKHRTEIKALLKDMCSDCGCTPAELFRDKWDTEDMFADEQQNQNLLAWFGCEEAARQSAYKNGIDI